MEKSKGKKITIYDFFIEINIDRTQSKEYQNTIKHLTNDYKTAFFQDEKDEIMQKIYDYKSEMSSDKKVILNLKTEAYTKDTFNGKITNKEVAKSCKEFLKYFLENYFDEKVIVTENEILLKMDGIGIFTGKNISKVENGEYKVKLNDIKIQEREGQITTIGIIGDTRRHIVEILMENLKDENNLFSKKLYQAILTRPHNPITESYYQGTNRFRLGFAASKNGYKDPRWVTFKQAQEKGWKIKKGEKGTLCEKYNFNKKITTKDETGKIIEYYEKLDNPYTSYFMLFNAEQIENIPPLEINKDKKSIDETIEEIVRNSGISIDIIKNQEASYNEKTDSLSIPDLIFFSSKEDYLETILHEMCHATGSDKRLNRHKQDGNLLREELITEIATLFLKSNLGISEIGEHINDHSVYYNYFSKMLETDFHDFFRACAEAEKAASFIYDEIQKNKELMKDPFEKLEITYISSDYDFQIAPNTKLKGKEAYELLKKTIEIDNQRNKGTYKIKLKLDYNDNIHILKLNLGNSEFGGKTNILEALKYNFISFENKMRNYISKNSSSNLTEKFKKQLEINEKILNHFQIAEKKYFYQQQNKEKQKIQKRSRERTRERSR